MSIGTTEAAPAREVADVEASPTPPASFNPWVPRLVLLVAVVGALVYRWSMRDVVTGDYRMFLQNWYQHLASAGGLAGLADASFSNYNTPYLALLALLTYVPSVPPLYGVKAISVVFDLVLAYFGYRIVALLRPASTWAPVAAAVALLFLPTLAMNSSAWAQCDSIYAAFCLGSLYYLLRDRPWVAMALFGVAFAFKLQAVFLLPALVGILIVNRQRLRSFTSLVAAPAAFLAMLVPALIAGRSILSQLSVYPAQMADSSAANVGARGGSSTSASLTANAPTVYAWLGGGDTVKYVGLGVAAAVTLAFGGWLLWRRRPLTGAQALAVAATSTLIIPFLLPQMHERYFYLAEVLLVLVACVQPWFAVPAALIQVASVGTYLSYLRGSNVWPLTVSAGFAAAACLCAGILLVWMCRPAPVTNPEPSPPDFAGDSRLC